MNIQVDTFILELNNGKAGGRERGDLQSSEKIHFCCGGVRSVKSTLQGGGGAVQKLVCYVCV